jgi:hypothetical protein
VYQIRIRAFEGGDGGGGFGRGPPTICRLCGKNKDRLRGGENMDCLRGGDNTVLDQIGSFLRDSWMDEPAGFHPNLPSATTGSKSVHEPQGY